jgi:hypothetical protein
MGGRYVRVSSSKRKVKAASGDRGTAVAVPALPPAASFEPRWSEPNFEVDWSSSRLGALVSPSHPDAEQQADVFAQALEPHLAGAQAGTLRGSARELAERRLGVDLEGTQIQTDASAHDVARDARAHAVTRDDTISFARGRFNPASEEGRRMIGHELTHVAQQQVHGVSATQPWAIDKTTATAKAEGEGDTLGKLAVALKGNANSWPCIVPLSMRSAEMTPRPKDFDQHYERFVQAGDTFDISRLLPGKSRLSLQMYLFSDTEESNQAAMAKRFYTGASAVSNPDLALRTASNEGATPVGEVVVIGHQVGGAMFGREGRFEPSSLSPDEPAVSFARANRGRLPRRCWLSTTAEARSVGCSSVAFGNAFASAYLRRGGVMMTTLTPVQPWCSDKFRTPKFDPQFPCGLPPNESLDAIRFITADPDGGPFTDRPSLEGASAFWIEIKGQL